MLHLDRSVSFVSGFSGWNKQVEILESTRLGLFDWLNRTPAGGVLQLPGRATLGVDFDRQRPRERRPHGHIVAHTCAPRRLPLAMDTQLGCADSHQHVAVSVVSTLIRPPGSRWTGAERPLPDGVKGLLPQSEVFE